MRAADRLVALAGRPGTAAELLLAIGSGSSAAAALVHYSGLIAGSAALHLMAERARVAVGGVTWGVRRRARPRRKRDEDLIITRPML